MHNRFVGIGLCFFACAIGLATFQPQAAPAQPAGLERALQKIPDHARLKMLAARQKGKGQKKGQTLQKGKKGKGKGQMQMRQKGRKGPR